MEAKNRSDSVDSRSYSFDSTDSKIKIIIKNVTKKRRKREQNIEDIAKSPIPDRNLYLSQIDNFIKGKQG
tara:strand:+ start:99 stop:308 length:210 start_codon:yes stop_codon:yes gene_type:complete